MTNIVRRRSVASFDGIGVDELHSSISLLRSDISLVGPRSLPDYVSASQIRGRARLTMRPGLIGLAQVSGATLMNCEEKVAVNPWYLTRASLKLYAEILLKTVRTVVIGEHRDEVLITRARAWTSHRSASLKGER